jgi:hypothetical protein
VPLKVMAKGTFKRDNTQPHACHARTQGKTPLQLSWGHLPGGRGCGQIEQKAVAFIGSHFSWPRFRWESWHGVSWHQVSTLKHVYLTT